jgi:hypothetical protein
LRQITDSSRGHIERSARGSGGSTTRIFSSTCVSVSPSKARTSVSASYSVAPSEKTSLRASMARRRELACSGTHVERRTRELAGARELELAFDRSDAEVGDLRRAVVRDQDVRGLEVAVEHAELVGLLQGVRELREKLGRPAPVLRGQLRRAAQLAQHVVERAARRD